MNYYKEPKGCKYYTEGDGAIYCGRDGSVRRKGCPCPKFRQRWKRFWDLG